MLGRWQQPALARITYRVRWLKFNFCLSKEEQEDIRSIIGGIASPKGRIHLSIGLPLNQFYDEFDPALRKNETLQEIANLIDNQIYKNYKLWPSNYYAYDLLTNKKQYGDKYDQKTIDIFSERLNFTQDLINYNIL